MRVMGTERRYIEVVMCIKRVEGGRTLKKHGRGKYTSANGGVYGECKDSKPHNISLFDVSFLTCSKDTRCVSIQELWT